MRTQTYPTTDCSVLPAEIVPAPRSTHLLVTRRRGESVVLLCPDGSVVLISVSRRVKLQLWAPESVEIRWQRAENTG